MSRAYGKVSLDMWGDAKFCALTPQQPSAQTLWIYLLVGPFRCSIPGLNLNVGAGGLSDRLGWKPAQVARHWRELEDRQMAVADWPHGLVWLPNGIKWNPPETPNVIRGWGKVALPECALARTVVQTLRLYVHSNLDAGFPSTFDATFPLGSPQGSANQEQQQDQYVPPPNPSLAGGARLLNRKPTKDERAYADAVRRGRGCPHDPPCENTPQCIGKLVAFHRLELAHGMRQEAAVGQDSEAGR